MAKLKQNKQNRHVLLDKQTNDLIVAFAKKSKIDSFSNAGRILIQKGSEYITQTTNL